MLKRILYKLLEPVISKIVLASLQNYIYNEYQGYDKKEEIIGRWISTLTMTSLSQYLTENGLYQSRDTVHDWIRAEARQVIQDRLSHFDFEKVVEKSILQQADMNYDDIFRDLIREMGGRYKGDSEEGKLMFTIRAKGTLDDSNN
jgi:hypothetical protein